MEAKIHITIDENYFIEGYISYKDVDISKQWIMYNQGYTLSTDADILDMQIANKSLCMKKVKINHQGSFSMKFYGNINVPCKSSFVKKDGYLEVSGNCGVIPIMADLLRCDFYVHAYIPQDYCLAGFKKIENRHYTLSVFNNYHVIFVMFKKSQIQVCQAENITVYAGVYHNKKQIMKMIDVCFEIWNHYETWFSKNEFDDLYLVLNPRFENGAYAVNNMICLVDKIEGLDQDTFMHIAHEISHLWWKNANLTTHDNWLNETFAQYSALLLIKEKFGECVYQKIVYQFEKDTQNLQSLSSIDEKTVKDIWFPVFYKKGPYLFAQLEKEIGYERIIKILAECYQRKIKESDEFLQICPEFRKYYKQ